jgi:hypothetical protein
MVTSKATVVLTANIAMRYVYEKLSVTQVNSLLDHCSNDKHRTGHFRLVMSSLGMPAALAKGNLGSFSLASQLR